MEMEKKRAKFSSQEFDEQETLQAPVKEQKKENDFLPTIKVKVSELPSKGIPYPEGAWIAHRPYVFGEIKQISQSKVSNEDAYKYILDGVECSFDKWDLTVPDALYIGLLRKISTLGTTEIIARYECGKCKKPGQFIFKTTDLEFDDLNIPELPIVADFSFGEVHFSPMTVKDYLRMVKKGKAEEEVALYAIQAKNMDFDVAYKKFFNASPEDAKTLLEVDRLLYHSIKPIKKQCANEIGEDVKCGNTINVELDGGQALLLPFRRDQESVKAKIRFGLENRS